MPMKQSAALVLLVMLTACQHRMTPTTETMDPTRVACGAFKPITYSFSQDTQTTRDQITAHNRVYEELCGD